MGEPVEAVPFPPAFEPTEREAAMVRSLRAERHDALATPRQVARFLCGLPSPSASRAKLTRHPMFGVLGGVPFQQVLALAEQHHS
jgi:ATP-dependent DNA helicase RecQ